HRIVSPLLLMIALGLWLLVLPGAVAPKPPKLPTETPTIAKTLQKLNPRKSQQEILNDLELPQPAEFWKMIHQSINVLLILSIIHDSLILRPPWMRLGPCSLPPIMVRRLPLMPSAGSS